jgi:hypothetical protein
MSTDLAVSPQNPEQVLRGHATFQSLQLRHLLVSNPPQFLSEVLSQFVINDVVVEFELNILFDLGDELGFTDIGS